MIILKEVIQCLERVPVDLEANLNRVNTIALDGQPQLSRFVPGICQRPIGYLTDGVLSPKFCRGRGVAQHPISFPASRGHQV
ncbi:hypothetical protein D3C73_1546880 [compost metagenome]